MESSQQETYNFNLNLVKLEIEEDCTYGCDNNINCFINVKDEQFEASESAIDGTLIYNNDFTEMQSCDASDLDEQIKSANLGREEQKSKFKREDSPKNLLHSGTLNEHPGCNQNLHTQKLQGDISETQISKEPKNLLTSKQIVTKRMKESFEDNTLSFLKYNCDVGSSKKNKLKETILQSNKTKRQLSGLVKSIEYKKTIFMCEHCKSQFHSKLDLQKHISVHSNIYTVSTNFTLLCKPEEFLEDQDTLRDSNKITPQLHLDTFATAERTEMHEHCIKIYGNCMNAQSHNETEPILSEKNQDVSKTSYLKLLKNRHLQQKLLKYVECNEKLSKIYNLETHTQEKPFKCEVCLNSFSQRCDLKRHLRTHTGEKPFKCEVCLKSFSQRCHFDIHFGTHTGEKPFNCEVCLKSFSKRYILIKHLRTHSGDKPFNCEVCFKSFLDIGNLNRHFRTHTGKKPFSCKVCFKSFSESGNLNRHLRTHTGKKPFSCKVCFKSFSQGCSLKKHLRTHTR